MNRTYFAWIGVLSSLLGCAGTRSASSGRVDTSAAAARSFAELDGRPQASPAPPPASARPVAAESPCDAEAERWQRQTPPADEDWVYGVGVAPARDAAFERARVAAAAALEVTVRAETIDRQIDWRRAGATGSQQSVETLNRSMIERRLAGCERLTSCQSRDGQVNLLARCSRLSVLEKELRRAADALAADLPEQSVSMVLPTTDNDGLITGLGEYASRVLHQHLARTVATPRSLVRPGNWVPIEFAELARKNKLTHVVRGEFMDLGGQRLRFQLAIMDVQTEQYLPRSEHGFEVTLEPAQVTLLETRGPLFPQKAALDLSATAGAGQPPLLRLASTDLTEGDEVGIQFQIPAPGYVYLFDIYENGQASLLLPSPQHSDNFFEAQRWFTFPDKADHKAGLVLKACPMPGQALNRERIKLVVTSAPLDLPLDRFTLADLSLLREGPRGTLAEVLARLKAAPSRGIIVSTATVPYSIRAKAGETGCPKN